MDGKINNHWVKYTIIMVQIKTPVYYKLTIAIIHCWKLQEVIDNIDNACGLTEIRKCLSVDFCPNGNLFLMNITENGQLSTNLFIIGLI